MSTPNSATIEDQPGTGQPSVSKTRSWGDEAKQLQLKAAQAAIAQKNLAAANSTTNTTSTDSSATISNGHHHQITPTTVPVPASTFPSPPPARSNTQSNSLQPTTLILHSPNPSITSIPTTGVATVPTPYFAPPAYDRLAPPSLIHVNSMNSDTGTGYSDISLTDQMHFARLQPQPSLSSSTSSISPLVPPPPPITFSHHATAAAAIPQQPEQAEIELRGLLARKEAIEKQVQQYLNQAKQQPSSSTSSPSSLRRLRSSNSTDSSSPDSQPLDLLQLQQNLVNSSLSALNQTLSSFYLLRDVYLAAAYAERRVRAQLILDQALQHTRKRGLEAMNDAVISVLASSLGAERVALYYAGKTHLFGLEPSDPNRCDEFRQRRFPRDQFLAGWSCTHAAPVLLPKKAWQHPFFDSVPDGLAGTQSRSIMCAPVLDEHEGVLAVIQVVNKIIVRAPPPPPPSTALTDRDSSSSSQPTRAASATAGVGTSSTIRRATSSNIISSPSLQLAQTPADSNDAGVGPPLPLKRMYSTPASAPRPSPVHEDMNERDASGKPIPLMLPSPTAHLAAGHDAPPFHLRLPSTGETEEFIPPASASLDPLQLSRPPSPSPVLTASSSTTTLPITQTSSTVTDDGVDTAKSNEPAVSAEPEEEESEFNLEDLDLLTQLARSLCAPLKRFLPEIVLDQFTLSGYTTSVSAGEQLVGALGTFGGVTAPPPSASIGIRPSTAHGPRLSLTESMASSVSSSTSSMTARAGAVSVNLTDSASGSQHQNVTPDPSPRARFVDREKRGSVESIESTSSKREDGVSIFNNSNPDTASQPVSVPNSRSSGTTLVRRDTPPPVPASLPTMSRLAFSPLPTAIAQNTPQANRAAFVSPPLTASTQQDVQDAQTVRSLVHSYAVSETSLTAGRGSTARSSRSRTLSFQWPGGNVPSEKSSPAQYHLTASGQEILSTTPSVLSPSHHLSHPTSIPTHPNQRVFSIEDLHSLHFNVFDYSEHELLRFTVGIFRSMGLIDEFKISPSVLQRFLLGIVKNYHANPFHNFIHGFSVMHFAYFTLRHSTAASHLLPHDVLALLVASLAHDLDHPGNTNAFEINSQSELALLYNDQHVLEQHHNATLFSILRNEKCNIFGGLSIDIRNSVRTCIIKAILCTDMAEHFSELKKLDEACTKMAAIRATLMHQQATFGAVDGGANAALVSDSRHSSWPPLSSSAPNNSSLLAQAMDARPTTSQGQNTLTAAPTSPLIQQQQQSPQPFVCPLPFDPEQEKERQSLVNIIIHSADLSGQVFPTHIARQWEERISREFEAQANKETAMGLPVAPFMKGLDSLKTRAKLQVNFIEFVLLPWWRSVARLLTPALDSALRFLTSNKEYFERLASTLPDEHPNPSSTILTPPKTPVTPSFVRGVSSPQAIGTPRTPISTNGASHGSFKTVGSATDSPPIVKALDQAASATLSTSAKQQQAPLDPAAHSQLHQSTSPQTPTRGVATASAVLKSVPMLPSTPSRASGGAGSLQGLLSSADRKRSSSEFGRVHSRSEADTQANTIEQFRAAAGLTRTNSTKEEQSTTK